MQYAVPMPDNRRLEDAPHVCALREYARVRGIAEEYAISIYEREIEGLSASARVHAFVAIIAEKRTKDAIRTYATGGKAAGSGRNAT